MAQAQDTLTQARPIIADRCEFITALQSLSRGGILVRNGDDPCGCVLDGSFVHHSFATLRRYDLIAAFDNPLGFPGVEYYRITPRGREFARRAWDHWRSRSVWERLLVRLTG